MRFVSKCEIGHEEKMPVSMTAIRRNAVVSPQNVQAATVKSSSVSENVGIRVILNM